MQVAILNRSQFRWDLLADAARGSKTWKAIAHQTFAVTPDVVKRKDPLTMAVNGSDEWALRGSNPRPHGCDAHSRLKITSPKSPKKPWFV
jgi:hypothetical protein